MGKVKLSAEAKESLDAIRDIVANKEAHKLVGTKLLQLEEVYYSITGIVPNRGCESCKAAYMQIVYNYITHHEERTEPVKVIASTAKLKVSDPKKVIIPNPEDLPKVVSLSELPSTKPELWKIAKEKGFKGKYQTAKEAELIEFIKAN